MNLQKLFETQKVLRDRIGYKGEDRFEKLILALQVEIAECANEFRGFKFWSKNQKSNLIDVVLKSEYRKKHNVIEGFTKSGTRRLILDDIEIPFTKIDEFYEIKNPLLEEYVDALHFLLEIGLELKYTNLSLASYETPSIEYQFNEVITACCKVRESVESDWQEEEKQDEFDNLCMGFIGLGRMLGFTWEEIETAYFEKNKINHIRQDTGY
ncbi:dUTPase [Niallia circulans]|uniref:dUTP diphosphatase n=1 Tax=Niallia circulans TaxID=1397 RepID=UPI00077C8E43|nr:dUTP diphosphatase [Niallia circulans]MDR4315006.1 dUTPase [Niallia circulans]MED3839731.1 dUTP diphosphatase [Niallia circulans]MED4241216.1 dUTP diphosphatase [Niallia circulans]MED4247877.1 dUTP diphosphatase [Niallia circulans]QKH61641.1 dUTP diphosphatase [Niallia circulans]